MEVWIITRNGTPDATVYVGTEAASKAGGISRTSLIQGKRSWLVGDTVIRFTRAAVEKNKARGKGDLSKFGKPRDV